MGIFPLKLPNLLNTILKLISWICAIANWYRSRRNLMYCHLIFDRSRAIGIWRALQTAVGCAELIWGIHYTSLTLVIAIDSSALYKSQLATERLKSPLIIQIDTIDTTPLGWKISPSIEAMYILCYDEIRLVSFVKIRKFHVLTCNDYKDISLSRQIVPKNRKFTMKTDWLKSLPSFKAPLKINSITKAIAISGLAIGAAATIPAAPPGAVLLNNLSSG